MAAVTSRHGFYSQLGWVLLFGGQVTGSVYGMMWAKEQNAKVELENVQLKTVMQQELNRIAAKREAEGRPSKLLNAAKAKQAEADEKAAVAAELMANLLPMQLEAQTAQARQR